MAVIMVPYHQDERLDDGQIPLPVTDGFRLVDPALPDGDIWRRLATLDGAAADQIAADVREAGQPRSSPATVCSRWRRWPGPSGPASMPDGPLIVHVDVDVTDPDELPGLLFPAPGGPPAAEVVAAVRRILTTGRVSVLDIACPWLPTTDQGVQQARAELLRNMISGQAPVVGRP